MGSKLRFRGLTANQLARMLTNASREGREAAFQAMREEANEIKEISIKQSPVDTGELEAAHRLIINRNQTDKAHYTIEVGGTINGVNVEDYAEIIHEGIGWTKLGERSMAKQGRVAPYIVGEKFLERALESRLQIMTKRVADAAALGTIRNVR